MFILPSYSKLPSVLFSSKKVLLHHRSYHHWAKVGYFKDEGKDLVVEMMVKVLRAVKMRIKENGIGEDEGDANSARVPVAYAIVGRDEMKKIRLDHLKPDQEMLVIKIFSERKKENLMVTVGGLDDGAFGGVGDEEVVMGEGVVVTSLSLEMLTKSCLGGIMVSLIFLEGLEEEAFMEFMGMVLRRRRWIRKKRRKLILQLKA
ncbi:hypothetical protein Tco_0585712 [Tanacetum coccineum]